MAFKFYNLNMNEYVYHSHLCGDHMTWHRTTSHTLYRIKEEVYRFLSELSQIK